jgi:hypothetical protein
MRTCGGGLQVQVQQQLFSVLAWTIYWQGFGLSDHLFVMRYPWGKVHYPLFGYLAQGLLPEEFSVKVKVIRGRLRPMVG